MDHQGTVIRPPSEAESILFQVTLGCTHNKCSFCGAYRDKRFAIKPEETFLEDIAFAQKYCGRQRRAFLCDGDVLTLSTSRIKTYLIQIKQNLPQVLRVSAYGNAKGLRNKSVAELEELREHGLGVVYMGLESGDDATLEAVNKGVDSATIIEQGRKIRTAGIKLNVTALLGLAGTERSLTHARATGLALSRMQPDYVGVLSLMLIPGTPLYADWEAGRFALPGAYGMLKELREMLAATELSRGVFMANHASNYLPIRCRMPGQKGTTLAKIDQALAGNTPLTPESMRRL